jgi:hypothetical protein
MCNFSSLTCRLAVVICLLVSTHGRGATIWNESTQGDLSGNQSAPTTLALSAGNNDLIATSQGGDLEYVTVTVPPGSTMTGLFLRTYTGFDNLAFLGMQRGATFTESPFAPNVANLLGWTHFGPGAGNVGADLLPGIGMGPGAQGFTPPLPADSYTLWLQQLGAATNYQLDFVVAASAPPTWNADANGNWSAAGNWTTGVPNAPGARAVFGGVITAPRTVTVDVPITVGRVDFDNAIAYTIGGSNALTVDATSGTAEINVISGGHTISAPVTLADDTQISVMPAAGNLTFAGALTASGVNVTKLGAGRLTVNSLRAAALSINEGKVAVASNGAASSVSVLGALSIAGAPATPTAQLDLSSNVAILDYTGATPAATIRSQLIAGRGGPGFGATWTGQGITSSTAAAAEPESRSVGYAENSSLPLGAYTNFRGRPVDDTSVLMAYTRTGDANLDGVVNDDDVTIVGATYAPGVTQPSWALGDFDYNGFVDDDDVTLLGVFYDPSAPPIGEVPPHMHATAAVAAVPEPRSLLLAALAIAALLAWRARGGGLLRLAEYKP